MTQATPELRRYEEAAAPRWYTSWRTWAVLLAVVAIYAYGWELTDVDLVQSVRDLPNMGRVLAQLVRPNLDPAFLAEITGLMVQTVFLGVIATSLAVVLAIPLSFLGARNLMGANRATLAVYTLVRLFFTIVRSIDILIVVILFVVAMGIGSAAGVFALAFHNIGVLGKLYAEAIENIDAGPIEAITSTGANRLQVVWFAVLPQIVNPFIALSIYRLDTNVRLAPIIGLVGGGGIGTQLIQYLGFLQYQDASPILIEIIIVVATMDLLSGQIRKRLA
ncbi:MAG: phosphonate ABC transporter, permease protein PhnE [Chloroflexota bacterium]